MHPHGVSGIGDAARRESVSCEQIAELIVPARLRNSNDRDKGSAKCEAEHGNQQNRKSPARSEEHTSELQSPCNLVCRLLLEKKKKKNRTSTKTSIANKNR